MCVQKELVFKCNWTGSNIFGKWIKMLIVGWESPAESFLCNPSLFAGQPPPKQHLLPVTFSQFHLIEVFYFNQKKSLRYREQRTERWDLISNLNWNFTFKLTNSHLAKLRMITTQKGGIYLAVKFCFKFWNSI